MSRSTRAKTDTAPAPFQRPIASGLTAVGAVLVVLGLGRALIVLEVLPDEVAAWAGNWWPAAFVVAGVWLSAAGRRALGTVLILLGGVLLLTTAVPEGFVAPFLLIGLGVLFLAGAVGGRRWVIGGSNVAVFEDVELTDRRMSDGEPTRSFVAVFGEASGRLDPELVGTGPVDCLAVFGDVEVEVPSEVDVVLTETAVFGDVKAPAPPTGEVTATVTVRATAVFGDVELRRR